MTTDSGTTCAAESTGRRCWFDATMLMHSNHPAGIPRTVASLLACWPSADRDRLRFFRYAHKSGFRLLESAAVWRRADELSTKGGGSGPSTSRSKAGFLGSGYLGRRLASAAKAPFKFVEKMARRLRSAVGRVEMGVQPRDAVFLPGGHFPPKAYFEELRRAVPADASVWSMIYDLLPETCPQYFDESLATAYSRWLRESFGIGSGFLAISECTKSDVLAYASRNALPAPRVEVVRLGDELHFDASESAGPPAFAECVSDGGFVLCVSHFYPRKNQELLYQTWRRLKQRGVVGLPHLVFVSGGTVGRRELVSEIFRDPLLKGRVHLLERVSDAELRWLYRKSQFVMYPAIYEGWGLPVAEALAFGKYCIASNASSIPEIGGGLADYHDPFDVVECSRLVARAIAEPDYVRRREALVRSGYRTTAWADCSAQVANVLLRDGGIKSTERVSLAKAA